MNPCERFESDLSAWLDDELERADQLQLVDHLVRCPACRDFTAGARSLQGWVATVRPPRDAVEPAPDVWRNIQRSFAAAPVDQAPSRSAWATGLRAAAVVILSVGLGALFMSGPAPVKPGDRFAEIQLGEDPDGMDDTRFMALTTEVLRADPRYHAALYRVMEQVVRDTGAREMPAEYSDSADAGEDSVRAEMANRNPV